LENAAFDYLSASRMNAMLNRALVDFTDYWPWPWLRKQVTGPAPLEISDLRLVLHVSDPQGKEMWGMSDYEDVDYDFAGTPLNWWVDDTSGTATLKVWPVGDVDLTVRYVAEASILTQSDDEPPIPERYRHIWVDLAVLRGYLDSDNFSAAQALKQDIDQSLISLVERYETRNRMNSQNMLIRLPSEDE